jgi:SMC interacting uncharacterized protein involved in chromosome segregation
MNKYDHLKSKVDCHRITTHEYKELEKEKQKLENQLEEFKQKLENQLEEFEGDELRYKFKYFSLKRELTIIRTLYHNKMYNYTILFKKLIGHLEDNSDLQICIICTEKYIVGYELECKHTFCFECVDNQIDERCAICRKESCVLIPKLIFKKKKN